jgi:hypothetical protein
VRNGGNAFFWNGSAVQFEVALFSQADLVTDISNYDSMTCEIKRSLDGKDRTGVDVANDCERFIEWNADANRLGRGR